MNMEYRKINDEVLYPEQRFVELNAKDVVFLKTEAFKNPRKRVRICTHQSPDDQLRRCSLSMPRMRMSVRINM